MSNFSLRLLGVLTRWPDRFHKLYASRTLSLAERMQVQVHKLMLNDERWVSNRKIVKNRWKYKNSRKGFRNASNCEIYRCIPEVINSFRLNAFPELGQYALIETLTRMSSCWLNLHQNKTPYSLTYCRSKITEDSSLSNSSHESMFVVWRHSLARFEYSFEVPSSWPSNNMNSSTDNLSLRIAELYFVSAVDFGSASKNSRVKKVMNSAKQEMS